MVLITLISVSLEQSNASSVHPLQHLDNQVWDLLTNSRVYADYTCVTYF